MEQQQWIPTGSRASSRTKCPPRSRKRLWTLCWHLFFVETKNGFRGGKSRFKDRTRSDRGSRASSRTKCPPRSRKRLWTLCWHLFFVETKNGFRGGKSRFKDRTR